MKKIIALCITLLITSGCHFLRDDSQYKTVREQQIAQQSAKKQYVQPQRKTVVRQQKMQSPYQDLCNYPVVFEEALPKPRPQAMQCPACNCRNQMGYAQPQYQPATYNGGCGCKNQHYNQQNTHYAANYNLNCACQMGDGAVQMISVPVAR